MRAPPSAQLLMTNPFTRTEGQILFPCCQAGVVLEGLSSCDKLKLTDREPHVYRMMMQDVAGDDSGLSLARRLGATCFLRWIMSVIPDAVIQACYQNATKNRALENMVSSIILNVNQSAVIEKDDDSRQSLENHANIAVAMTYIVP